MTCRALMPPLLRWAVRRGNLEAAKVALRTIGKSRAQRHNSSLLLRPLYSACYSGNIQVVQLLLEYAPEAGKFANSHNYYGLTRHLTPSLLCTTIKMGFVEIAKLILQSGASVSYRPPNIRKLPIHEAAQHGYSGLMEILLEADATIVDQPDFCGKSALRIATENGHTNVIKVLMSFGAQHQYFSRFFFDCQSDMELHTWLNTRPLINHLYEGFECSHSKISPLQWAARNEDLGQMQLLLDRGANIDDPSPLPIAIQEECWTSVRFLVTSGANIKTKGQPGLAAAIDRAIQYGDRKYLDYLTINGAKIDPSADYVANAFMEAASVGDLEMVQYLLNLKVDVNISVGAKTALLEAIRGCHLDVTKYLLGQNAEIDLIYSNHPWSAALGAALTWNEDLSVQDTPSYDDWSEKIHNNRLKILELLFEYGARFDELDAREYTRTKRILIPKTPGEPERSLVFEEDDRSDEVTQGPCSRYLKVSPFVRAVASGVEISILEDLIERGADVNTPVTRTNVSTALQAASMHRSVDVVRFLLAAGADVNANPNSYFDARLPFGGRTALQAAASASDTTLDHLTKVRILVREHANVNAPAASIGGVTALQGAAIVGNIEMVRYLLDHGADVNAPKAEVNGRTALEGAADLGRLDIVQLLLNAGADSHVALEWRYVTALKYAEVNNYIAIEELLQKQRFKDLKEAKVFNNDATEVSSEQNQTVLGGLDDVSGVDLSGEGVDVNPMPTEMQPFVELPVPAGLSDSLDQTQEYEAMSPAYEEWMRIFEPNGLGDLSVEHDLGFDRT
ncbi:MAG: hypothetical protein M1814_003289 [Vezdaea aestivalis]|nr:MAG: hypothetical protein M1814_003289 [Vezdaea aestivalis]